MALIERGLQGPFGDARWNAHTHALASKATAAVNVEETMEVFRLMDKDASGDVDVDELLRAAESPYVRRLLSSTHNFVLTSLLRSMEDRAEFERIFREIDPNDDKKITEKEPGPARLPPRPRS